MWGQSRSPGFPAPAASFIRRDYPIRVPALREIFNVYRRLAGETGPLGRHGF
jgi:hypothetical protein